MNFDTEIKIGDTIRSLDFPKIHTDLSGENACYMEGVVLEEFVDPIRQKGPYFKVKLTKRIFGGEECDFSEDPIRFCPMPHAVGMDGKKLNGTTKINSI